MVELRPAEIRIIDEAFQMNEGYVLTFSDKTFAEYFDGEFGIDIYDEKYAFNGASKAKRLRAFIKVEDEYTVSKVLRGLWSYSERVPKSHSWSLEAPKAEKDVKTPLFDLITRIESGSPLPKTDALICFKEDETLEELIAAIERDIQANRPAAALDRLHTYCMKKFAYLLEKRGESCTREEPLHSRFGRYVKSLEKQENLREISKLIMKSSISVYERFNNTRNFESFAHDNVLIDKAEARFIFDTITAILRFIKTTEADKYGL